MFTLSDKHAKQLIDALKRTQKRFLAVKEAIWRMTARDRQWVAIILILAALLRFPFMNLVDHTQFDEVYLAFFSTHMLTGTPFFDIHPPLVRIIFTEVVRGIDFRAWTLKVLPQQPFADFPYLPLRYLVACFGTLLPLLIYMIGRLMNYSPRMAALPALFVVFDNALVIYSRVMLPDTLLLIFEFLSFAAALAAVKSGSGRQRFALTLLSGIAAGCALSTKWLALGVIGVVGLVFLFEKRYLSMLSIGFIALVVYVTVFFGYFSYFPHGGALDPEAFPAVAALEGLTLPSDHSLSSLTHAFVATHKAMLAANNDPYVVATIMRSEGAYTWIIAKSGIDFWVGKDGKKLTLQGNALLWVVTALLFFFEIGWLVAQYFKNKKISVDRYELLLIIGYVANYLPFFFIHRAMYLYHYFAALLFLFLLIPKIAPRAIDCLADLSRDRLFAQVFAAATFLLIVINFFLIAPTTYGF